MKPIQEITLFESTKPVDDIGMFVHPQDWIEISIPQDGLLVEDRLLIKETSNEHLIARTVNIGNFCSGVESTPVFLRIHANETIIVSRLANMNIREDEIHLKDFRILKRGWKTRSEERVQPKHPVYFTFSEENQEIRANLHDISVKGMCVIANIPASEIPENLKESDLSLTLNIEPFFEDFKVKGIIKNYRSLTENLTRIGLEIFPERNDFRNLENFVNVRKQEITEEIFSNFRHLLNYPQAPDLRF